MNEVELMSHHHDEKKTIEEQIIQAKIDDGKLGTDSIKEIIEVIALIAGEVKNELSDGAQITDAVSLGKFLLTNDKFKDSFKLAIHDFKNIPAEALDLKISEIVDLFRFTAEKVNQVLKQ